MANQGWQKKVYSTQALSSFKPIPGPRIEMPKKEPLDFWSLYFDDGLLPLVVKFGNKNALNDGHIEVFTIDDARRFVIIELAMGLVGLHDQSDYWADPPSLQGLFPFRFFASIIPRDRYKVLKRYMVIPRSEGTKFLNTTSDKFWNSTQFVSLLHQLTTLIILLTCVLYLGK